MTVPRSIRARLSLVLVALVLLVTGVGVAGLVVLDRATAHVERLTLGMTPANDANLHVRLHLLAASGAGHVWLATGQSEQAAHARQECHRAATRVTEIDSLLRDPELTRLTRAEGEAVTAWCERLSQALATGDHRAVPTQAAALTANDAVGGWLDAERRHARADVRRLRITGLLTLFALTMLAVGAAILGTLRTVRWVGRPLSALVDVLENLRAGASHTRVEPAGGDEVRRVAAAVNALADESDRLRSEQAESVRLREGMLQANRAIHAELDPDLVLVTAAEHLGRLLKVRRVWVRGLDPTDLEPVLAQWQAPGLAPIHDPIVLGPWPAEPALPGRGGSGGRIATLADTAGSALAATPEGRRLLAATGARALLQAQVEGPDRPLACIWVAEADPREFDQQELLAVDSICRALGQALSQSQLFQTQAELVDRLQELDRQKDDFVSTVSHELRTPLASILGYTESVLDGDGGPLPEGVASMMRVVERNADRLSTLIQNLLTLSRMQTGPQTTRLVDIDLVRVIEAVLATLVPQVRASGLILTHPAQRARRRRTMAESAHGQGKTAQAEQCRVRGRTPAAATGTGQDAGVGEDHRPASGRHLRGP